MSSTEFFKIMYLRICKEKTYNKTKTYTFISKEKYDAIKAEIKRRQGFLILNTK
jgi:hypothetical protein